MDEPYRATSDIDLLAFGESDGETIRRIITTVCAVPCPEDGITFDLDTLKISPIQDNQGYRGQRARFHARLGKAKITVQVDFGFDDVVTPEPEEAQLPTLLDGVPEPSLRTYPQVSTIAEKFEAMVRFGTNNGRMKDFYDVWALSETFAFDGAELREAVAQCFERRGAAWSVTTPDALTSAFYSSANLRDSWQSYGQKKEILSPPPSAFEDVGSRIQSFLGPVRESIMANDAFNMHWSAGGTWVSRPKVFISYHHGDDQEYKDRLVQALDSKVVDRSISPGDIHGENLPLDELRRRIRDDHIADAAVIIVLIGPCTWQRKHVDWEISACLIDSLKNPRCGILGLLLPTHPDYRKSPEERNPRLIPPRLARNIGGDDPFAVIYDWPQSGLSRKILPRMQTAYQRRNRPPWPDNSLAMFRNNRSGNCSEGWQKLGQDGFEMATLMTKYDSYPGYKPTDVEWLGEIPGHWEIMRLAWITECLDGQRIPLNGEQRGGMRGDIPYWGANSIVDRIDSWLFDEELVLLGEDGAPFFDRNREVAFTVNGKVWVNNHAHVLRPGPQVLARFLSAVLNCVDYAAFIDGTTRDKLTQGDMNVIPVQLPPLPEQRAIAAFLDRETANIDSLVAKKERLIELLQEKRTALISRTVTKGLDPDVPMKDSGVEWLGEIPAHWEVKRMKHLAGKIGSGKTPKGGAEIYVHDGIMLIRSQNVHFGGLRLSDVRLHWTLRQTLRWLVVE